MKRNHSLNGFDCVRGKTGEGGPQRPVGGTILIGLI